MPGVHFVRDTVVSRGALLLDAAATLVGASCRQEGIGGVLSYFTDLFDAPTMKRLAQHFCALLATAPASAHIPLSQMSLMDDEERQLTLHSFNDTAEPYHADLAIHQLFEQAASRSPAAACLVWGDQQLTYAAVNAAANQLAHWLVSRGVAAGSAVGVSLPKCSQLYIALLAVLKAGGYYVPLDPELPAERAAYMLQQSGVRLLLAASDASTANLPGVEVVVLDQGWQRFEDRSTANLQPRAGPNDMAYCLYTSGSTGQPKVSA